MSVRPFQNLYAHLKSTDLNLYETLNRLFDLFSDVTNRLDTLEPLVDKKLAISDSGLVWIPNPIYEQYTVVVHSGHLYVRLFAGRSSTTPNIDTYNWFLLV